MKYEITKEQIVEIELLICAHGKNKIKEWFPEAFKPVLEKGKWYKSLSEFGSLFEYLGNGKARGFFQGWDWTDKWDWIDNVGVREATESEVFEAFKNEAVKRGFVEGVCFFIVNGERESIHITSLPRFGYDSFCNKLLMNGWCIFEDGRWSTPIITITKEAAEKQLGKKII